MPGGLRRGLVWLWRERDGGGGGELPGTLRRDLERLRRGKSPAGDKFAGGLVTAARVFGFSERPTVERARQLWKVANGKRSRGRECKREKHLAGVTLAAAGALHASDRKTASVR